MAGRGLIAVTGATGYVGGRLVPELLDGGHRVRALSRTPAKLAGRAFAGHERLESVRADVLDAASLGPALEGVEVAYYLVHSMAGGAGFAERDAAAARTFAEACERAGVTRIVYLSGLGSEDDPALSEHLGSRHDTGRALRCAGVPVTELRAAVVIGSGSASFEIIRDLAARLPLMVAPRWVESRVEPIAIRDVVAYLVAVLDEPRTVGEVLEIGGGEVHTFRALVELAGEELGRRPRIWPVPVLTPRLSAWWLHLVTDVDRSVARPLVEGMRSDVVVRDARIREWIDVPLTPYRLAVRRALARGREPTRWSSWTDASRGARPARHPGAARRRYRDYRTVDTDLAPDALFDGLLRIGGAYGYGVGVHALWALRGAVDRLVGGPGLRRGRPRGELHEGDPLDFWRVARIVPGERLLLAAEMRLPGEATLDFRVEPLPGGGSRLHQVAMLDGTGPGAPLYWNLVLPAHGFVFRRLAEHVVERGRDAARP